MNKSEISLCPYRVHAKLFLLHHVACSYGIINANGVVSDDDLCILKNSKGRHAQLMSDMCKFYRDWHVNSDGVYGTFLFYD